jgi:anti-sigma B factor antagonist
MSEEFRVSVRDLENDSAVVVDVAGELDMESSPKLLEAIRTAVRRSLSVKVNVEGVSYVDSSGIAVLIQGYKLALKRKAGYALVNPSQQMRAVIELSQLDSFFPMETTTDGIP